MRLGTYIYHDFMPYNKRICQQYNKSSVTNLDKLLYFHSSFLSCAAIPVTAL